MKPSTCFATETIVISLALVLPSWHTLAAGNNGMVETQIQRLQQHKHDQNSAWPSFTNDSSYIYLLGLFTEQGTSISNYSQNSMEAAMFRAAVLLSQTYNITANGKRFAYRTEHTSGRDVIETLDRTCQAITENQVLGIVGPDYSSEATIISRFANRAGLPVFGYAATDPKLSNRNAYPTYYRLPPSDIITARALLKLYQKYKWSSTNVIYQSDNFGEGGLKAMTDIFNDEIKISHVIKYDLSTDRIDNLQHQLQRSPSRIVIVWANANVTIKIIELALEAGNILAPSFLWILIASDSTIRIVDNPNVSQLAGMLILRLVTPDLFHGPINTTLLHNATALWKTYDPQSYPGDETDIDMFALYAFDGAWLLILAIEKLWQQYPNTNLSLVNTTSCFSSQLLNSTELNRIIQTIDFIGVSGHVQFQPTVTDRIDSTIAHYMIDNVQPSKENINKLQVVEVLKLNGTAMNIRDENTPQWVKLDHPIRWPNESLEPPKDYATLKGYTLNITVYVSPPFFMMEFDKDNNSQSSGYIHDLVVLLEERMGFNFSYIVAPTEVSYNELVDCVQNRTYDIVMADLTVTSNRTKKIDFSYPIYDNTMRLVIRKSKKITIRPFALFEPFSYGLWLLIASVVYLCSALLIAFYEFSGRSTVQMGEQNDDVYHGEKLTIIVRSLYHTIAALLQGGSTLQTRTFFGCLQTVIVWMMSLILVALLTSNLTSYFNAQREKPWLQSIDDLQMCRKVPCNRIGVVERSQHEEYFTTEVTNGFQTNYYHLKHPNESYTKLLDHHIDVAIADSSSADYFTQTPGYCQLEVSGIPFGKTYFGVAFRKDWPYQQDLNNHIVSLKLEMELDQLSKKWFQQKNCDRENGVEIDDGNDPLTILETSGLFYIFATMTGINLIGFVVVAGRLSLCRKKDPEPDTSQLSAGNSDTSSLACRNSLTPRLSVGNSEQTYF